MCTIAFIAYASSWGVGGCPLQLWKVKYITNWLKKKSKYLYDSAKLNSKP